MAIKSFFSKILNWLKKYPVIVSLAIIVPSLIYTGRYAFTTEYFYFNTEFEGEKMPVKPKDFKITGIKPLGQIVQVASMFSYQGAACYQNYYAICADNFETILIYDANTMKVEHIIKTNMSTTLWHCNTIFFGPYFFNASDKFPLLYVSMENPNVHSTIVFRIHARGGEYYIERIQQIELHFDKPEDIIYFPNSYYDFDSGYIYYGGYTQNSYMRSPENKIKYYTFLLPDYRSDNEYLMTSESLDTFELPSETATQGGFISHNHLYEAFSFGFRYDQNPLHTPALRVVDLVEHKIIYEITDLGAEFGVYEEFEHLAISDSGRLLSVGNPFNLYEFEYEHVDYPDEDVEDIDEDI